jgi:hypothetical protein
MRACKRMCAAWCHAVSDIYAQASWPMAVGVVASCMHGRGDKRLFQSLLGLGPRIFTGGAALGSGSS